MPLVILLLILLPTIAFGADPVKYKPLIEGIGLGGEGSFDAFINQLYIFSITLAALFAVIKIIVAGVKYSLSEIVNTKGEAKGEIRGRSLWSSHRHECCTYSRSNQPSVGKYQLSIQSRLSGCRITRQ
jgi:hypothetical protein